MCFLRVCGASKSSPKAINFDAENAVAEKIQIRQFTQAEIDLLLEYATILEPVAHVLNVSQTENKIFAGLGIILPTLVKLKTVLQMMPFTHLSAIRDRIIKKIDER